MYSEKIKKEGNLEEQENKITEEYLENLDKEQEEKELYVAA